METLTLDASGMTFDALAAGPPDGRVVLLLHGFPQGPRQWQRVMAALAGAGFRAVAPDQRGYSPGARPAAVEAYVMRELVADVLGFADALGAERFDLVGHDFGAAVAWQTAARHPARVRSLTSVSVPHPLAFTDALRHDDEQRAMSAYMREHQQPGVSERLLSADGWQGLREMFEGKVAPADVEHYVERLAADGALTAALSWYRAMGADAIEGLGAVEVPTLYVWSDGDHALGSFAARATERHVSAPYRFEVLEGISHWIPDEAPAALTSALLEHLAATRMN